MFGLTGPQSVLDQFGIHLDLFRYLLVGGLIFMRVFILTLFVPFLGARPVPGRVRVAISLAFVIFFYGPVNATAGATLPTEGVVIVALFVKEVFFAVLLGFVAGMLFFGAQAAGNMVDNQRQLANAQIFNPGIGSQASLFGVFYYQLTIVIFLLVGGHRLIIRALASSFASVPLLQLPQIPPGVGPVLDLVLKLSADIFIIALQLGAPVLVAIFIADIILGLTNRVAPMVNVFEMGFNIKGFLGVLMVYLSLPFIIFQIKVWAKDYMQGLNRLVELFFP